MAKRQSVGKLFVLQAARSRSEMANRLAISWLLDVCWSSHLFRNQLCKLGFATQYKYLFASHYATQKLIFGGHFRAEFGNGKDEWVDLSAELLLGGAERGDYITERRFSDDHEIHVAVRLLAVSSDRAVNEGSFNLRLQGGERRADGVVDADSLRDQPLDFRKNWALFIRPVENLVALDPADDESHVGQLLDFSLQSTVASAHRSDELTKIERFVRVAKKQREQGAAGAAKENAVGRGTSCTHSEYDCTPTGYNTATRLSNQAPRKSGIMPAARVHENPAQAKLERGTLKSCFEG
jgi:hypothetical protein